ncbi:SDR family NAD(P)-dependent oxidoreductase [Adlercreutzia sp. ZJ473]|uniref:SDR family NAD(P)-dependent oxidoreductase n=1 Tax=Adlercreutzia sp. ZJ473 TaxID=2722822 RepID=UPI001557D743|nr:glucose 1-dehydrogenase [Adlercreutzia sp. ZJ473]
MAADRYTVQDRVAIITGASSRGIGNAAAKELAAHGAKVCLVARREDKLKDAVGEIAEAGGTAMYVVADVSREDDCKRAVEECVARFGKLDIMVLASGIAGTPPQSLDDMFDTEEYRRVLSVNLDGVFFMVKHGYAECAKGGHGSIVFINSLAGFKAAGFLPYSASKGAIRSWTKLLAKKLAPLGVRVNAIIPGMIDTDMTHPAGYDELFEGIAANAVKGIPLGRLGTPADCAKGILFLASDASEWTTGYSLAIDGGELCS